MSRTELRSCDAVGHGPGVKKARVGVACALLAALLMSEPARGQDGSGYVYVGTNESVSPGKNSIRGYRRDAQGQLSELPGSPFLTRGTGVNPTASLTFANVGPLDSDQSIIFDEARKRLFAVNGGSDSIAVMNVASNGQLTHVPGSPFPSYGVNPASVGLTPSGGVLVVANKDYDLGRPGFNPNARQGSYITFRVNAQGQLSKLPISAIPAGPVGGIGPGHATPTQALISKDGRLAFDANFFGFQVRSFRIAPGGQLTPSSNFTPPGPPLSPAGTNMLGLPIPLGLQVHPTQPILYVGFVLDKTVGIYVYGPQGQMVFVKAATDVGSGPCWLLTNAAGTRLYTSNNFDNSVSVLDISDPFNPVKLQQLTLPQGPSHAAPFQLALDRSDRFLHIVSQSATPTESELVSNSLTVLRVAGDGTLSRADYIPLPSFNGSRPQGVAAR